MSSHLSESDPDDQNGNRCEDSSSRCRPGVLVDLAWVVEAQESPYQAGATAEQYVQQRGGSEYQADTAISLLPDSSFETNNALYFSLNPYVKDNNDKLLTLTWSARSSEPAVEVLINNDNKWVTILARNWTGEADIMLTVTDPFGDSDSDTMHVVVNGQTDVEEVTTLSVPEEFVLHQNYPNPFNPETTISYGLPEASEVTITVYDMNGRKVNDLFEGRKEQGVHILRWNALDCPSGVYFIQMQVGAAFVDMRKCVLMK